jgi:predicted nucleic acid-binding protein
MIVIADTGPLNYLIQIKCDSLLQTLFTRVIIPHAVVLELTHAEAPRIILDWATNLPPWIELKRASSSGDPYLQNLGSGEREAILLAEELSADLLLLDDKRGRAEDDCEPLVRSVCWLKRINEDWSTLRKLIGV